MNKKGSALVIVLVLMGVLAFMGAAFLKVVIADSMNTKKQINHQRALFLAESGIQRAAWIIRDVNNTGILSSESFTLKNNDETALNSLENEYININIVTQGDDVYLASVTSQSSGATKTLNALIEKYPPGKIFDYTYFINNWGWFYASLITSYGDLRSNGRFDFKYGPQVNSDIYAANEVGINGAIYGYGSQAEYQHSDSQKLAMPNLNDLSYYEAAAATTNGSIVINGTTIVDKVLGDNVGENENIVLVGTAQNPIEVNGVVVIRGDVIVSGVITGQGSIYTGRNLYVPNNITYNNGPTTEKPLYPVDAPPSTTDVDTWVNDNKTKDLVGFAAAESIILGDYTKSGNQWIFDQYLYSMGDEDVGNDGIPGTSDSGENDGQFNSQFEDLDGDGSKDNNYSSSTLNTQTALSDFSNVPAGMNTYSDLVNNPATADPSGNITVSGIFYTNHAVTGTFEGPTTVNGSLISKDEAIGISNTLVLNYDWRVNSRYTSGQNKIIDVGLPFSKSVEILRWW